MTVEICRCKRCSHEWAKRAKHEPKNCPNCKSHLWNKEYTRKRKAMA